MMDFFKSKMDETFILLGRKMGYLKNESDIYDWCRNGMISYSEAVFLKKYNREISN